MSSIDELFKKGIGTEGLPYDEGNWKAMETLLEAKPTFWARYKYVVLAVFLLFSGGLTYFSWPSQAPEIAQKSQVVPLIQEQQAQTQTSSPQDFEQLNNEELSPSEADGNDITNGQMNQTPPIATAQPTITHVPPPVRVYIDDEEDFAIEKISVKQVEPIKQPSVPKLKEYKRFDGLLLSIDAKNQWSLPSKQSNIETSLIPAPEMKSQRFGFFVMPYAVYTNYQRNTAERGMKLTESTLSSIGAGAYVGLRRGSWKLFSGIEQTTIRENVSYTTEQRTMRFDTSLVLVEQAFGSTPSGNRLALLDEQVDTTVSVRTQTLCHDCAVSFRYVTVPAQMGYEWGRSRWKIGLNAGVRFMLLQRGTGLYTTDEVPEGYVVSDLASSNVLTPLVTLWSSSAQLEYRLSSQTSVWSSFTQSFGGNSMLTTYQQVPSLRQVRVGMALRW
jgi:hypothetical protein